MNQKLILKKWFDTTRYVYNKGLEEINKNSKQSFYDLRNKLVTSKGNQLNDWELEVPKDVRAGSLRDLIKARNIAFTNLKNGNINKFSMKFRTKRSGIKSIEVPKSSVRYNSESDNIEIFKTYKLGPIKICKRDSIPVNFLNNDQKFDLRMIVDKRGHYYLIIPYESKIKSNKSNDLCSLDPGIRKFQTLYSNKEAIKFTVNKESLRKFKNRISNKPHRQINKKNIKLWNRHKNLITDMHDKIINYLVNNYSTIFLPKFESQKLTKNKSKTFNFNLLNLQHYRFKERLRTKCIEYSSKFIDCTEEYTSKTCTRCGVLNEIGMSEIFECSSCKLKIDRDLNGSRNILLKNIN